jgi:tetratricopeptide (TPR) repeat protein
MKRIFLLLLALAITARATTPDADFAKANAAYSGGNYLEAKQDYEALLRRGTSAANLFYNLGNANWRLHDPGQAALAYTRALMLAPAQTEAKANLDFVRQQTNATLFKPKSSAVIFPKVNPNWLIWLASGCAWVVILSLLAVSLRWLRDGTWVGLILVLALLLGGYCGTAIWHAETFRRVAIVVAAKAEARYAPADNSALADTLTAGSEVRILQNSGDWTYCLLPGDVRAWLPSSAIESVLPAHA